MTTIQEVLAQLEVHRADLQRDLDSFKNVLLGTGFIVVSGSGLPLSFTIKDKKVTNPIVTRASMATRFTKADAERVAANVTDGNGDPAVVRHVRDQLQIEIEHTNSTINAIRANCDLS